MLPYVAQLPVTNVVFREALSRGVEIDTHGNVYGLLKISHPSNEPVCYNVQRINLTALVAILEPDFVHISGNSERARKIFDSIRSCRQSIHTYSKYGWSVRNLVYLRLLEDSWVFSED